ncbi:MAG: hypothetical protein ACRC2R_09710 [Xenococcaceae cyanobacterium]
MRIIIALIVAVAAFYAFSTMIFGAIDKTVTDPAWFYNLALNVSLASAGFSSGYISYSEKNNSIEKILKIVSIITNGMLFGFFYGGLLSNKNLQIAILSALAVSIVSAIASIKSKHRSIAIAVKTCGALAAYGFAFVAGNYASASLSTQHFVNSIGWAILAIVYILLTINSLTCILKKIRRSNFY